MLFIAHTNSNGILTDPCAGSNLRWLLEETDEVFVYAFGWNTDFQRGAADYNRFAAGLVPRLPPNPRRLLIPVFWLSVLSENPGSPLNVVNPLTFYTDEHRADQVGQNAVYAILRACLDRPRKIILLGHSFGTKVVTAGLQRLAQTKEIIPDGTTIRAVLLQAAFKNDAFEPDPGKDYSDVLPQLPIQILATTSLLDKALGEAFPAAEAINVLCPDHDRVALGFAGPSTPNSKITVQPIDNWQKQTGLLNEPFGGEHNNVYNIPELYQRIVNFIA